MAKSSPINQIGWTKKILDATGSPYNDLVVDSLRKSWWFNPLNSRSMRLTKRGVNYAIDQAKIHYYLHDLTDKIMPKTLLQLEKILEYPYYVKTLTKIIILDERTSLTLTLYGNDLQTYLDNVQKFN